MRQVKRRVLLVENDRLRAESARRGLSDAYEIGVARTLEEMLEVVMRAPWDAAIVPSDLAPGGSGLEALQALREASPRTFRVLCLGAASPAHRFDSIRLACPHAVVDPREEDFMRSVRSALDALFEPPAVDGVDEEAWTGPHEPWVTHAPVSRVFVASLRAAAAGDAPVYLYGEPGCGQAGAAKTLRDWRRARRGTIPGHGAPDVRVLTLRVPALRERTQDLPALARRILAQHACRSGAPMSTLSPEAVAELGRRAWYGNTDELVDVLARACQRAGARTVLEADDLPRGQHSGVRPSQRAKDDGQLECVLRQLRAARNVTGAARLEGSTRANYIRMLRRLGVLRADIAYDGEPSA